MDRMEFDVQGSAPLPYRVTIEKHGDNLNIYCTCAAGDNGQSCKHKLRILSGNPEGVVAPDVVQLRLVVDWVSGTDVEVALTALAKAEEELEREKNARKKASLEFARALRG